MPDFVQEREADAVLACLAEAWPACLLPEEYALTLELPSPYASSFDDKADAGSASVLEVADLTTAAPTSPLTFSAHVRIRFSIDSAALSQHAGGRVPRELALHAHSSLDIKRASLRAAESEGLAEGSGLDDNMRPTSFRHPVGPRRDLCAIRLPDQKDSPQAWLLDLDYTGAISSSPEGLFCLCGSQTRPPTALPAVGTSLEPCYARRVLPCWDSPVHKARWRCIVRGVPAAWRCISVMPVAAEHHRAQGFKDVEFETTPFPLAPYAFGLFCGPFISHLVAAPEFGGLSVGIHWLRQSAVSALASSASGGEIEASQGASEAELQRCAFPAKHLAAAFGFLKRLLGEGATPYPLPKLDILALDNHRGLGLENMGCVSFKEDYLLAGPSSSFERRRRVARLCAHELSHLWVGNHVTPRSFNHLWLKEGLARFLEFIVVEATQPGFRIWENFLLGVFMQALLQDADEARSHAVDQLLGEDPDQILSSFDTITYGKAACVLRMLTSLPGLGDEAFLRALASLVEGAPFATMTPEDFLGALAAHATPEVGPGPSWCTRDALQELFAAWLRRPGLPTVSVSVGGAGRELLLRQSRFTIVSPDGAQAPPEQLLWPVPVQLRVVSDNPVSGRTSEDLLIRLDDHGCSVQLPQDPVAVVVNPHCVGYYQVRYSVEAWQLAFHALELDALDELEELGIVVQLITATYDRYLSREDVCELISRLEAVSSLLEERRPMGSACSVAFESLVALSLRRLEQIGTWQVWPDDARARLQEKSLHAVKEKVEARLRWLEERKTDHEELTEGMDSLQHWHQLAVSLVQHVCRLHEDRAGGVETSMFHL